MFNIIETAMASGYKTPYGKFLTGVQELTEDSIWDIAMVIVTLLAVVVALFGPYFWHLIQARRFSNVLDADLGNKYQMLKRVNLQDGITIHGKSYTALDMKIVMLRELNIFRWNDLKAEIITHNPKKYQYYADLYEILFGISLKLEIGDSAAISENKGVNYFAATQQVKIFIERYESRIKRSFRDIVFDVFKKTPPKQGL